MQPSVFTRIINKEIPCYKIYEDNKVIAFLDLHPKNPGHTLVVPKKQIDHIWDMPEKDYEYLWSITKKLGKHIKQTIGSPRVGIIVEGFGVPHVHVHLVPIYDVHDINKPQNMDVGPDNEALQKMADKLKLSNE